MISKPKGIEIDHHVTKLLIGFIALLLAGMANQLSGLPPVDSISESYYRGDWARNIFVGFLFVIFALLLTYNGRSWLECALSKVAAISSLGVALFPCDCETKTAAAMTVISKIHSGSAAIMFIILAIFCYFFIQRAKTKHYPQAKRRIVIYAICCAAILFSIIMIAASLLSDNNKLNIIIPRLIYKFEALGLIAFGVAWLTASRTLPIITHNDERISISPFADQTNN